MTLLPKPSIHLNKTLTRLKSNLCWNTIYRFFEREIWQRVEYYFRIHPRSKILSLSDCTRTVKLLPRPSIHLIKSLTRLKSNLCWNTIYRVFEREIWQRVEYYFRIHPRSKILSLSDCTRTVKLLPRPSIHLIKSLTRLKSNLCWNTIYRVFEREIWQRVEYYFRIHPRSKILSLSDCTRTVKLLPRP